MFTHTILNRVQTNSLRSFQSYLMLQKILVIFLKKSTITIILKPDKDATCPGSYRPIKLLPVLGKLMEKIMNKSISEYMIKKIPLKQISNWLSEG